MRLDGERVRLGAERWDGGGVWGLIVEQEDKRTGKVKGSWNANAAFF